MSKWPAWTQYEKQIVMDNFPERGVRGCAEHLNRPAGSIAKMAQKLGVTADMSKVRRYYGMCKHNLPEGYSMSKQGYVTVREGRTNALLHRRVYERHIGRKLTAFEVVHHKDGDKLNNDIGNLELTTRAGHMNMHRKQLRHSPTPPATGEGVANPTT